MAYQFYFDGSQIPITPGSVTISTSGNNKTVTLIDQGEVNILKLPQLKEISFDVLLPTQEYPFASTDDTTPVNWLDTFESYKQNKQAFQFVIIRSTDTGDTFHDTSIRCSLEDYEIQEDADEYGFDTNVSVKLKEYKDYGTKTVLLKSMVGPTTQREQDNAPTTPATVPVSKADNPVVLSKKYTGTSTNARTIADKNNYGSSTSSGFYRDYGAGTKAGSDNAAYVQGQKDSAASKKNNVNIPSTKMTLTNQTVSKSGTSPRSILSNSSNTTKTTHKSSSDLLSSAMAKAKSA